MARLTGYDRAAAVRYAEKWALRRNPEYADFTPLGGDCTNFVSQCLYAGSRLMNTTPDTGWYFRSMGSRAPAWSGVKFLHRFLTRTSGAGPKGEKSQVSSLLPGDVVFLSDGNRLYHALFVVAAGENPMVAAHTADSWMRPLSTYYYEEAVPVHILGVIR